MLSFLQTNISKGALVARFDSAGGVEVHAKIAKKTKAEINPTQAKEVENEESKKVNESIQFQFLTSVFLVEN